MYLNLCILLIISERKFFDWTFLFILIFQYNRLINDMLAIYNKAQICTFDKPFDCGLKLYPDLKKIMANGRDWDELVYVWGEWRRKSGENMKELYEQLVDLTNLAANYNSKWIKRNPVK